MEHQKTLNLFHEASGYKIVTRKRNIFNDQASRNYDVWNGIIYNREVFKSKFFDYNDSWLLEMLQLQQHSKIVDHLLSVSQKLMEQH